MKWNKSATIAIATASLGLTFGVALSTQFRPAPDRTVAPETPIEQITKTTTKPTKPRPSATPLKTRPSTSTVTSAKPKENLAEAIPHEETSLAEPSSSVNSQPITKDSSFDGAPVVCIDPGHPSETSSGANAHGLSENRLNWQVALKIKERLETMGIQCILTKDEENQYRTNRQRAETANNAKAVVLVRLHCDVGGGQGYTWYYPDRSGSKAGVTGPPKDVQEGSRRAAYIINETMKPILNGHLQSNSIKTDASTFVGGKQGGVLTGSIFARVPTALIEMCYINQKHDAQFIASQIGQDKMAEALAKGIYAYVYQAN